MCITNIGQKNLSNPTKRFYRVKVHKSTGSVGAWRAGPTRWAGRQRVEGGGGQCSTRTTFFFFFFLVFYARLRLSAFSFPSNVALPAKTSVPVCILLLLLLSSVARLRASWLGGGGGRGRGLKLIGCSCCCCGHIQDRKRRGAASSPVRGSLKPKRLQ